MQSVRCLLLVDIIFLQFILIVIRIEYIILLLDPIEQQLQEFDSVQRSLAEQVIHDEILVRS